MKRKTQRKWTHEEEACLERLYPLLGPALCAARLGRTPLSVNQKASRMGLTRQRLPPRGWEFLGAVAQGSGVHFTTLLHRARSEGVYRKHRGRALVPLAWAEQMVGEYGRKAALEGAGYYTTRDVRRVFGVNNRRLTLALRGEGDLAPYVAPLGRREGLRGAVYFNPWEVEQAARRWRQRLTS